MVRAPTRSSYRPEQQFHVLRRWKGRPYEVVSDRVVFFSVQKNAIRIIDSASSASHLLVIVHNGRRPLVVNDEAKVGFVEPHSQSNSRYQDFDLVVEESVLQILPLV